VLLSTDGGNNFTTLKTFSDGGSSLDQPTITTGPGGAQAQSSVWVTFYDHATSDIVASGAPVTGSGLGQVGAWTVLQHIPNSTQFNYGDICIGPAGQVGVVFQSMANPNGPTEVRMSVNPYGTSQNAFAYAWTVLTSQVGFLQKPPSTPYRGLDVEPGFAWDCTGGPHRGRLYMVYTDRPATDLNNMSIYAIYSDHNGSAGTWSGPLEINTDGTTTSHFDPRIALDQTSGKVAVSWYDCRNDPGNNIETQFYAAVSSDGGQTFSTPNLQLEAGQSDISLTHPQYRLDYLDYTGLAFYGGYFYPAWADNSNTTGGNPNGTGQMDIYVARVRY
jgi:hypothetical protein